MGNAGYNTVVKRSGTSTSFTGESMTATSETNQFQIDDGTKEVWDRTVVPTFYEDGTEIPFSDIENINYLFGKVTFSTSKSGAVTVDGSYFPTQEVACAKSYTLDQSINLEDSTCYDNNNGYRQYTSTLYDVSASITRWVTEMTELEALNSIWRNSEEIILEIQPAGVETFRGYMLIESDALNGDIESLEEQEISFQANGQDGTALGWD